MTQKVHVSFFCVFLIYEEAQDEESNYNQQTVCQWLTTGNLLVVAMITPLSAFLQKRFRLKQLFIFGTLCFVAGTVVAIFSPNFGFLLQATGFKVYETKEKQD